MLESITEEWHQFRADPPGERFENHYRRMRWQGFGAGALVRLVLGVPLLLVGIVLLFIPGPGLLVTVLGLALVAGNSRSVARALDRIEPRVRRWLHAAGHRWRALPSAVRVATIAASAVVVAGVVVAGVVVLHWR